MKEVAVATATAIAVIGLLGVSGVSIPARYDMTEGESTMPDDSLYELELAGETIREKFQEIGIDGDQEEWNKDRWSERLSEMEEMAKQNNIQEQEETLEKAQNRLRNIYQYVDNEEQLSESEDITSTHIDVLQSVKTITPENAREGINTAIGKSQRYREVLENARGKPDIRNIVDEGIRNIPDETPPIGGNEENGEEGDVPLEDIDPDDYELSSYSNIELVDGERTLIAYDEDIGQYREYDPEGTQTLDLDLAVALAKSEGLWDTWMQFLDT